MRFLFGIIRKSCRCVVAGFCLFLGFFVICYTFLFVRFGLTFVSLSLFGFLQSGIRLSLFTCAWHTFFVILFFGGTFCVLVCPGFLYSFGCVFRFFWSVVVFPFGLYILVIRWFCFVLCHSCLFTFLSLFTLFNLLGLSRLCGFRFGFLLFNFLSCFRLRFGARLLGFFLLWWRLSLFGFFIFGLFCVLAVLIFFFFCSAFWGEKTLIVYTLT